MFPYVLSYWLHSSPRTPSLDLLACSEVTYNASLPCRPCPADFSWSWNWPSITKAEESALFTECLWQFLSCNFVFSFFKCIIQLMLQDGTCSSFPQVHVFHIWDLCFTAVHGWKLLLCQMWTLTDFNSKNRCWSLLQLNTCWKSGWLYIYIMHPIILFWQFSVQRTIHIFDTARALRSLPAVCSASIPKGCTQCWSLVCVPSNKGVCQQEDGETKLGLKAQYASVSSLCIILADFCKYFWGAVGMGHIFLLLDIKECDVGQCCGMSKLFTFTNAVFPSWFVNKLCEVLPRLGLDLYRLVDATTCTVGLLFHTLYACYWEYRFSAVATQKEPCFICQMELHWK